jgi:type I restriction enzyme S subunit
MKWPMVPLKDVAPPSPSSVKFREGEEIWLLNLDQIEINTGHIINKVLIPVNQAGSSTSVFDSGNVLYSKLRPYLNKVVWPQTSGTATTELVPFRPNPKVLNCAYLAYYLRSDSFLSVANHYTTGAQLPRANVKQLLEHKLPLPPLSEQRRIVDLLDQADALRRKRAEADAKAARILPALFYQMFGDPATNPMGWPVVSSGTIFSEIRYGVGSPPPFAASGIPFLRAANIKPDGVNDKDLVYFAPSYAESIRRSHVRSGDIVVVRRGAYTGDCAVVPPRYDGAFVGYDLICVPGPETNPFWFAAAWNFPTIWPRIENLRSRAAQQGLNKQQIESFCLPRPTESLQDEFGNRVMELSTLRDKLTTSRNQLDGLYQTLLRRAFSGELTAGWREAHMAELLEEMEHQEKALGAMPGKEQLPLRLG